MTGALRVMMPGAGPSRDATVETATSLGLAGWARCDDGLLRVHAEGSDEALQQLIAWMASLGVAKAEMVKPEGHEQFAARGVPAGDFQVLLDPFRLVLALGEDFLCWTVPKGPSMDPAAKRLAVPLRKFTPNQSDLVFDSGAYEQGGRVPWPEAVERGHAVFVLHGKRLRGGFALQRTRPPQWLLIKRRDEFAESDWHIDDSSP